MGQNEGKITYNAKIQTKFLMIFFSFQNGIFLTKRQFSPNVQCFFSLSAFCVIMHDDVEVGMASALAYKKE